MRSSLGAGAWGSVIVALKSCGEPDVGLGTCQGQEAMPIALALDRSVGGHPGDMPRDGISAANGAPHSFRFVEVGGGAMGKRRFDLEVRKNTRVNSRHSWASRLPCSAYKIKYKQ